MKNRRKIYVVILLFILPLVWLYAQQSNYNQQLISLLKDYPDSLSYNKANNDYTLWKNVGDEYIPIASNLSIADVVAIQNRQSGSNDIYNQTEALSGLNDQIVPSLQATPALYNRIFNNAYLKPPNIKYDVSAIKQILSTAQGLASSYKQIKYKFKSEKAKIDSLRKLLANDSLSKAISDSLKQVLIDTLFALVKPLINFNIKGSIGINLGVMRQSTSNPSIPLSSRVTWAPIFGVDANFSTSAALGSKISVPSLGFSTRGIGNSLGSLGSGFGTIAPQFGVDNAWRISYKNDGDEILRSLEFFNTGFVTPSLLIPSVNSIFGVSGKLQFGRFAFATTLGKQNSQMQSIQVLPGKGTFYNLDVSNYDENKNFLLAQYFYKTFNKSLSRLPAILSNIRILRIEVWVTNRYNQTSNVRQVVGFSDIAESKPYNSRWNGTIDSLPHNSANDLYQWVSSQGGLRDAKDVNSVLTSIGMRQSVDYEQVYARKLNENEYYFQPQLGYIALKIQLQPDDILGVAFQYSYNGRIYQVGELSESVPPDTLGTNQGISKNLYVKLLKSTVANTQIPLWNLMMKNIYTISSGAMQPTDFTMDVVYNNPGKGSQIILPGEVLKSNYTNKTLLQLLRLDTLNAQGNPLPDGVFDYIENITVLSEMGKIVFPVLQPFGKDLSHALVQDTAITNKYLFQPLYDTLQAIARTFSYLNRYVLRGSYKSTVNAAGLVQLGYNITPGSVKVMAGSMALAEGIDYVVNYGVGTLQILNPVYLNSQVPLNVLFENNSLFGLQTNFFWGVRWDYLFKNKRFKIGGTFEGVKQLPFTKKVMYGQDPTNNQMYGLDFSYMDTYPWLTSVINLYPTIKTNAPSTLSVYGEGALLNPGHPNVIGKGANGTIYIDDFEGSQTSFELRSMTKWALASPPLGAKADSNQANTLFPMDSANAITFGYNRARLAWYIIDPTLQDPTNPANPFFGNAAQTTQSEVRSILQNELFPNVTYNPGQNILSTFDLAYYPYERGPFNYNTSIDSLTREGTFKNGKTQWGGIMTSFNQTDFESSNIQYIRFWLKDPYTNKTNPDPNGGYLYFQLGDVSEDIMRDGNRFAENGMPTPDKNNPIDSSTWGYYPVNSTQITYAFDNNPNNRPFQDVGLDGLNDDQERSYFSKYLNEVNTKFGGSTFATNAGNDPSNDNFRHYFQTETDPTMGILQRYKLWNNTQGNSPIATNTNSFAATLYPDVEDLNRDNTLSQTESYYQYKVQLKPTMGIDPNNFIVDERTISVPSPNGNYEEKWYLFQIPVDQYNLNFNNKQGFQSIRFMRMFLTGFQDSAVVLRFAQFNLMLNQWRSYNYKLDTTGVEGAQIDKRNTTTTFNVASVNIQEDERRSPIPYRMPPGVERQQTVGSGSNVLLMNEQSISLQVRNLPNKDIRGILKLFNNMDLRNYGRMSMFIHAETPNNNTIGNGQILAVIRLGADLVSNYYEIRIPLQITREGAANSVYEIWPEINNLDFDVGVLPQLKMARDVKGIPNSQFYAEQIDGRTYAVMGQPNIAQIQTMFLGMANESGTTIDNASVWFNELRLSNINEKLAWSAVGKVNLKLADIGNINVSALYKSVGWGTLNQNASQRAQSDQLNFSINANFALDRFFPKVIGMVLPFYISYTTDIQTPKYAPLDPDVNLDEAIRRLNLNRDSMYAASRTTQQTFAFAFPTIQIFSQLPKIIPVSPSNITFNYSYTNTIISNPQIQEDNLKMYIAGLNYQYSLPNFVWQPFKKMKSLTSPWARIIRDFNLRPYPNSMAIGLTFQRQFEFITLRNIYHYDNFLVQNFNKYFYITRTYNVNWQLANSLNLQYNGLQRSFVDEPNGFINTKELKQQFWKRTFSLGRNTFYMHNISGSYVLPLYKIPALEFLSSRFNATASYQWTASSTLTQDIQGNTIGTSMTWNNASILDFNRLYTKSRWLTNVLNSNMKQLKTRKEKILKPFLHLLTAIKMVNFDYSENYTGTIPGITNEMNAFGQTWKFKTPFSLLIGLPVDSSFLNMGARRGWFISSPDFNGVFEQSYTQNVKVSVDIRPMPTFQIQLLANYSFTKSYSEIFKDTLGNGNFAHLSPFNSGGFTISYIALQTMFAPFDPNKPTGLLADFMNNRAAASRRLGRLNPYSQGQALQNGFASGYGQYSSDVLMLAFISTYSKTSIEKTPLIKGYNTNLRSNPFAGFFPLPNWRLTYAGLSDLLHIPKDIIGRIILQHGYNGTLSVNSFSNNLLYSDPLYRGWPGFLDPVSNNFIPYFLVPNITITDQFFPLIGTDINFLKTFTAGFTWNKSRIVSLSIVDYQITQQQSNEYIMRFGWQKTGIKLPFKLPFPKAKNLTSDLIFNFDFSYRDDVNINTIIDQEVSNITGGNRIITVAPYIDYIIQKQFSIRLYMNLQNTYPKLSTTSPSSVMSLGLQIKWTFL